MSEGARTGGAAGAPLTLPLPPRRYLAERGLATGSGPARFPEPYGPAERDVAYTALSLDGWAGRSGHDAPMIAYDALLGAGASWDQLCARAAFHGGEWRSRRPHASCTAPAHSPEPAAASRVVLRRAPGHPAPAPATAEGLCYAWP